MMPCLLLHLLTGCGSTSTIGDNSSNEPHFYLASYDVVYNEAELAISSLNWRIIRSSKDEGTIEATVKLNLLTSGDKILIIIGANDDGRVRVDVSSHSPYQLFAWGKNKRNIRNFYAELDSRLGTE